MQSRSPIPAVLAVVAVLVIGVAGVLFAQSQAPTQPRCYGPDCAQPYCPGPYCPQPYSPEPEPQPIPQPAPPLLPAPRPCPNCPNQPRRPWGDEVVQPAFGAIVEGGPVAPDGVTEVTCDMPLELREKNKAGIDHKGLCVFAATQMAARYQNERRLWYFLRDMTRENGAGWPDKLEKMVQKYGNGAQVIQHTGGDLAFLREALKGGRMPCITYGGQDLHYGGQFVDHVCNLLYLSDDDNGLACVLDNNFVGTPTRDQLVWMTVKEFKPRWNGRSKGWAFIILSPPPMPPPRN